MVTITKGVKQPIDSPQRQPMSYEEYLEVASDSQITEWVNGEGITYMPLADRHQNVSQFLGTLLNLVINFFKLGIMRYAPFEVKLGSDGPAREPDIIFIANDNIAILGDKRIEGAPDLLIEIISPSSITEDRVRKFTEYEQAGVREYWVIDPRQHQQQADFYVLGEDQRYHAVPLDERGVYTSTVLPGFWLDTTWLWQSNLPNPHTTFAEIIVTTEGLPEDIRAAYRTIQKWFVSKQDQNKE